VDLYLYVREALADEIAACRTIHGSLWTDEWDERLIARCEELGGTLAVVDLAGDMVTAEFMRTDPRPGPRGFLS